MLHMRAIALCAYNVYSANKDDPPTLISNQVNVTKKKGLDINIVLIINVLVMKRLISDQCRTRYQQTQDVDPMLVGAHRIRNAYPTLKPHLR